MFRCAPILTLLIAYSLITTTFGQVKSDSTVQLNAIDQFLKQEKGNAARTSFPVGIGNFKDSVIVAAQRDALVAYYTFTRDEFDRASRVFYWQMISTRIIFFIVIGLVISGIWFSGVQFYHSIKVGKEVEETKLEISNRGIKIHSSILGLLILFLSIAFFYLYLVYVYPIHKI